jgi:hypothetical protein
LQTFLILFLEYCKGFRKKIGKNVWKFLAAKKQWLNLDKVDSLKICADRFATGKQKNSLKSYKEVCKGLHFQRYSGSSVAYQ